MARQNLYWFGCHGEPSTPSNIDDFKAFQNGKEFRALTYCHIRVTIDDSSQQITAFEVVDAVHDPGWTPPFKVSSYPTTGIFTLLDGWNAVRQVWSFQYHQGEASPPFACEHPSAAR
jgi:hypothetical protein